jgi:hypothetical protein
MITNIKSLQIMITLSKKRKYVSVNYCFDNPLNPNTIIEFNKEHLEKIKKCNCIGYKIKNKIISNIPENIIKIIFGGCFNLDVQPYLHQGIHTLKFGHEFNLPVNNLPSNLIHLTLGAKFNRPVNNLPSGLKYLYFGGSFSYPVDMLPESLEIIYLSGNFNYPVNNLPQGIKELRLLGHSFNFPIDSLPNSIEILQLHHKYKISINKLPDNLKILNFDKYCTCTVDINKLKIITDAKILM